MNIMYALAIATFLTVMSPTVCSEETERSAGLLGLDHLALSVSDLDASADFFVNTLGFKIGGRDNSYPAVFMGNGSMRLTLWQTDDNEVRFDRKKNVGLHHVAIQVVSFEALDNLYKKIKQLPNVNIEFAPELSYGGPAKHMMVYEPSGNRIELIHRPAP